MRCQVGLRGEHVGLSSLACAYHKIHCYFLKNLFILHRNVSACDLQMKFNIKKIKLENSILMKQETEFNEKTN